ncbi:MAG: cysteine dioxygenase [Arenicella sp.]
MIRFGERPWICALIEQIKKNSLNIDNQISETITSLSDLASTLSEGERTTYDNIIRSMTLPSDAFDSFCSWSDDGYTRNCIYDNEKFELILLCWEPGQLTPIHDHGGEECWVKVIKGEFRETIYQVDEADDLKAIKIATSKEGEITYMIDFMGFHRLENLSDTRSMSLHLYAKPIRSCKMFDEATGEFKRKKLVYNTVS